MILPLALLVLVGTQAPAGAQPPAPPQPVGQTALVVIGDGLSTRDLAASEQALRSAAHGLTLQDGATTSSRLDAASSRGFACAMRTVDCLVQVGVICGVEQVLLADLSSKPGSESSLLLVDVNEGIATRAARVDHRNANASFASLQSAAGAAAAAALATAEPTPPVAASPALPTEAGAPPAAVAPAREPSSLPLVGVIGGGVLVAAGAVTAGIGALDWLIAGDAEARLLVLEGQAQEKREDSAYLDEVRAERARFDDANESWVALGQPLVAVGAAVLGVGVGTVILSSFWWASE